MEENEEMTEAVIADRMKEHVYKILLPHISNTLNRHDGREHLTALYNDLNGSKEDQNKAVNYTLNMFLKIVKHMPARLNSSIHYVVVTFHESEIFRQMICDVTLQILKEVLDI